LHKHSIFFSKESFNVSSYFISREPYNVPRLLYLTELTSTPAVHTYTHYTLPRLHIQLHVCVRKGTPYLHVDQGRAGEVLGGRERDEPEHGEAAVPELGVGGHEAAAPVLGALPLEQRRQRRCGQHDGRVREPREPGAVADLREEAVSAGRLDGERGHEAHHGEAPIDPLRRGAAERQRVPEPLARRRLLLGALGLRILGLRPDEQCAPTRREPGRRKPGGEAAGARAGGGEGERTRGGGHHRGRHRE
jgi:hypothetical protein